ncbi:MAG TPA: hypothetical protein VLA05_08310 [Coriobacteriia bacterium]|nr:hypothetical protein [Coriobacteriia bacterium]
MVEDITSAAEGSEAFEAAPEPKRGLAGFAATKNGRLVLGGIGLLLVLAAIGAILFLFVLRPDDPDSAEALVPPAGAVSAPAADAEASDEESATPKDVKPLSSTFVFRDVFEPTMKPSTLPSSSQGTSTTDGGTSADGTTTDGTNSDGTDGGDGSGDDVDVPADTLLLQSVSTVDGEPVATFVWNGQTYTVGEGDQLGETPWQVLDISGNTVVMLYGDTRVTLTVGQGISK